MDMGGHPALLWVGTQIKTAIKWTLGDGSSGELQNIQVGAQPASLFALRPITANRIFHTDRAGRPGHSTESPAADRVSAW